jgi:hypothetical protein
MTDSFYLWKSSKAGFQMLNLSGCFLMPTQQFFSYNMTEQDNFQ